MTELADRNYFTDEAVLADPYGYFNSVREKARVYRHPRSDVVMVTGFDEAVEVLLDTEHYSNFTTSFPTTPLPFTPLGDDIGEQIEEALPQRPPMMNLLVNYDGERHLAARSLLRSLFTPSRLKANKAYMEDLAKRMIAEAVAKGTCEIVNEIATPFVTLVIADLLGVPADDREKFRKVIDEGPPAGNMDPDASSESQVLLYMAGFFMEYVQDRRANPREDVLTELSLATYPDGTLPELIEVVKSAMFLFAAGQDTSAKLIGNSVRHLIDHKDMQAKLRTEPELIPDFLEEMLRLEGSTKATFRLAKRSTVLGGVDIPAGQLLVIALSAANRDPERWEDPNGFILNRKRIREHVGFGRGAHTCLGAPLARAEVHVLMDELLRQTSDIALSEPHHGKPGQNKLKYEHSFIIRGLEELHVTLAGA